MGDASLTWAGGDGQKTNDDLCCGGVKDYDENDQDADTETYPGHVIENHPLIDCGGGGAADEETERTTLLGQSMLASRAGKLNVSLFLFIILFNLAALN